MVGQASHNDQNRTRNLSRQSSFLQADHFPPPDSRESTPCRGPVRRLAGVSALMSPGWNIAPVLSLYELGTFHLTIFNEWRFLLTG
jgi:hypothetical protein